MWHLRSQKSYNIFVAAAAAYERCTHHMLYVNKTLFSPSGALPIAPPRMELPPRRTPSPSAPAQPRSGGTKWLMSAVVEGGFAFCGQVYD